jgi:D-alanyl-lipoteichoic acid acyltransferase DltB (MBOAT superfamily)
MCFFPKLLQGPIERGGELLPQLHQPYTFDYQRMREGLWQVGWGLVKKLVLADRIAQFVNPVYDNVQNFYGLPLILATYLYALQVYFDFSGYTDMALGVARLFNIRLTQNFNRPYLATSIPEFWRRWHISFSRWILDYIFKPLQMWWRNARAWGTAAALLVTFLFSGVWHGISGGFVAWGLLHGIYMACSALFSQRVRKFLKARKLDKSKVVTALQVFITFHLVCFAWVFFRANNLSDGWYAATHLIYGVPTALRLLWSSLFPSVNSAGLLEFTQPLMLGQNLNSVLTLAGLLAAMAVLAILVPRCKDEHFPLGQPTAVRWAIYYLMVLVILFLGAYGSGQVFIYNQF